MKLFAEKIFALVLPLTVLLISSNVLAHEKSQVNQPADARPELSLTVLEIESFEDITKPLNEAIRQLGAWRSEWLAEKQRWNQWQSVLLKEGALDRLEAAFAKTDVTIETISNLAGTGLKSKESACEPPPSRLSTMPM
jgi:hypothetical protein